VLPLDDNVQLVTAQGFAVLCPSIFTDPKNSDFSAGLTRQTLDALDRAAATGLVDPSAAAFWGHSAGGYMALVIATQTNRFKAIIAAAPLTDYLSSYGQTRPAQWIGTTWPMGVAFSQGWAELGQGHTLATPWTNLDRYISLSPVFKANEINTPILIAQGDQDYLSFAQGQEMFAALYRLKKDALFVAAFGEGHEIMSPTNARAYYKIFFSFLDSSLRNGPR
jgi:dipeptidyl aminopeptidase/acylaminoacyl peptidase